MTVSFEYIRNTIQSSITQEDADVRQAYLAAFPQEIEQFANGMARAFGQWKKLDEGSSADPRHAYASGLVYSAITLHIGSMNLFLAGWLVAAGNVQRQVLETISLAFLVASRDLDVFERYSAGEYSSNKAPVALIKHRKKLNLDREAVEILNRAVKFYHNWSHPTLMTMATHIESSSNGLYVGAAFDDNLLPGYTKEARGRANLSDVFENFVMGVGNLLGIFADNSTEA